MTTEIAAALPGSGRYLADMEIRILGPIEVAVDGKAINPGGPRERALLAVLALTPGQVISSDRLIDDLWGEDLPANPQNALQAVVSRLRRAIGADVIVTRSPGYVLEIEPAAVDVGKLRLLMNRAAELGDPVERGDVYRDALGLWRGAALADFQLEEFAQRESSSLDELRLLATEGRIEADLERGGGAELIPELEQLIARHPLRESLRVHQMLALYRAGRQADALRAFTAARELLGEELGIEPGPELKAMEDAILMQDPGLGGSAPVSQSRLPARLASFVGRDQEMIDVADSFETSRLVTLTGAGGAGKTTLAIEVGRRLESGYPDGVWLIELAPVVDSARVGDAVVTALELEQVAGLGGQQTARVEASSLIVEYLRNRHALLIVDNCEHVVESAAALLETVLLACPAVEVLATSRDRLGIPGELLWRVPSLDTSAAAVDLFVERARAVNPAFLPDPGERETVAEICARVDGMPLAIELAAARVRSLPLDEINRRLQSDIGLLSGGPRRVTHRQQTLRGTIDWSYRLLGAQEADLFASLSVFHGSFALDAVDAVASDRVDDVLGSLERLIDSSMVTPVAAGRYRMLETLRVYAGDKLGDDLNASMTRLLVHFKVAMEPAQDGLSGPEQLDWMDRIEAEHDTMRAVLDWATVNSPDSGLELASMLGWYWFLRGNSREAKDRFEALLAATGSDASARARGDAHFFGALCAERPESAREGFEKARDVYAEAGFMRGVANATAMVAAFGFALEETIRLLDEAAEISAAVGYDWGVALTRFLQVGVATNGNDFELAGRLAEEATARFADLGDSWGQGYSLYFGGAVWRALGDYEKAEAAFREALEHARPMRLRREMAPVMSELGSIATMRGDYDEAERWLVDAQKYADEVPFAGSQGMVRNARGKLARMQGDLTEAHRLHNEALALYEPGDAHGGLAYTHSCLGFTAEMAGDLETAKTHHRAALQHAQQAGDVFAVALGIEGVGATEVARGDLELGLQMITAGLAIREQAGCALPAGEWFDIDRALAVASSGLSPADFEAARHSGAALTMDEALRLTE